MATLDREKARADLLTYIRTRLDLIQSGDEVKIHETSNKGFIDWSRDLECFLLTVEEKNWILSQEPRVDQFYGQTAVFLTDPATWT